MSTARHVVVEQEEEDDDDAFGSITTTTTTTTTTTISKRRRSKPKQQHHFSIIIIDIILDDHSLVSSKALSYGFTLELGSAVVPYQSGRYRGTSIGYYHHYHYLERGDEFYHSTKKESIQVFDTRRDVVDATHLVSHLLQQQQQQSER